MSTPRSLKAMSFDSRRCVPIRMSTLPEATSLTMRFTSRGVRIREIISMITGKAAKRFWNVFQCWKARIVVGASSATCLPSGTARIAARIATSVLP